MAWIYGNALARIYNSANLPSPTAVSMAAWVKINTMNAADANRCLIGLDNGSYELLGLAQVAYSTPATVLLKVPSGASTTLTTNCPTSTNWAYVAWSCTGTGANDFVGYVWNSSGTLVDTVSRAGASFTVASMNAGAVAGGSNGWTDMKMAYLRVWDRVLTEQNFRDQMFAPSIVGHAQETSIRCALLTSNLEDETSNGYDWTNHSTPVTFSDAENPPVVTSGSLVLPQYDRLFRQNTLLRM